ncbi:MAG: DUF4352 domain-containing protein [Sphaerobacter sp.]|nr:DUF4352 domain-containing protein [Sphaerobacter sp.]
MEQQVTGTLADGRTYRATSYAVEVLAQDGSVEEIVDLSQVTEVRRDGLTVTFKRRKGKPVSLTGATIADAGRLETTVRPAVPAASPKSGSSVGRVFRWGCLGTLALVAVLVVVTIASGGTGDEGSRGSSGAANSAPTAAAVGTKQVGTNKGDVHVPLAAGASGDVQEAKDKIHRVTIVEITDNAISANEFEKPATGNKYWVVKVVVENAGPAEIYLGSWKLRTTADFEYDPTFAVGFGESLSAIQNLTSGAKTQGVVVFEVPADAQPKFLRYDPNVFMKGDLYFDAQ